ncbi:DHS-like NAD/FAD-binding domain-containing protein [Lentinula aff. detonsa]|uniref:DHS-like NAD/FAD-binding domain-containing protein n=1 Tax=Lentinula aff. detonsa TaxID=2804958 RepID=A0AA38NIW0_9AGAR|nr:DHS-like NAD/FAD-binding domain-containing protein [Lentinula aff. detonsa]
MGPKLLAKLVHEGNIPVTTTLQGLGAFDETDGKSLHMLGMHGSAYANIAMQQADVIIALGARFDDRVTGKFDTFAPATRAAALQGRGGIIHFEIQPKNVNKVVQASIPILGDVVTNMASLVPVRWSPLEVSVPWALVFLPPSAPKLPHHKKWLSISTVMLRSV